MPNGRRAVRVLKTTRQGQGACQDCGHRDPVHAHRFRRKSRGKDRPAFVRDTMRCPNCGSEWRETTTFVKTELDSPKASR